MANPFGGSDEALTVNTGHTNYGDLLFAYIPRSTTKFVEVVNAATVTPTAGNYDADGYWRASGTSTNTSFYTLGTARSAGLAHTLIVGLRYNSAGGGSGAIQFGLGDSTPSTSINCVQCRPDVYARQMNGRLCDNAGFDSGGIRSASYNPGADTSAYALKSTSTGATVNAFTRVSGTNTANGSDSTVNLSTTDNGLTRLVVKTTNKWAFQYIFVYGAALSDANIDSIIDDPGSVISVASGGTGALSGSAMTPNSGVTTPAFSIPL